MPLPHYEGLGLSSQKIIKMDSQIVIAELIKNTGMGNCEKLLANFA